MEAAKESQRIGVFGGAFDPPHNAHVALAKAAIRQFSLTALHVMPTGQAWHKSRKISAPVHRLAMARLAFQDLAGVVVDDREMLRDGPTFTVDTLEELQAEQPAAQIFLFIGEDQFDAFREWKRWERIVDIAIICIACRTHPAVAQSQFDAFAPNNHRFFPLHFPQMPISATQVRLLAAEGQNCIICIADLVPEPVARYIALHRLYKPG